MISCRHAAGITGWCWVKIAMPGFRDHYKVRGEEMVIRRFDESVTLLGSPAIGMA